VTDREATIVVHGSREACTASAEAATRLRAAGFTNVIRFAGGREAWETAGLPFEGSRPDAPWRASTTPEVTDGTYEVDSEASLVEWTGRNVANRHFGTLRVAGGTLEVRNGRPSAGWVEVDMASMRVGDLEGDMADLLIAHLASEDFFSVETFPTARLDLRRAEALPEATPGTPNARITAFLSLRGVTEELIFSAVVAAPEEGAVAVQTVLELDRTRWGATYGSGKLFDRLGLHLVNDLVTLQVRVVARRSEPFSA
jgi:polyisoprenoid-binding protein YceI